MLEPDRSRRELHSATRRRRQWLGRVAAWLGAATSPGLFVSPVVAAQASLRELRLFAPGPRSTVSIPVELAQRLGLDSAQGLRMRVQATTGGAVALQNLVDRNADFAVAGLPAGMLMRSQGAPIVAIAAMELQPHYVLVVRKELAAQIRSVGALRGRTIGVHSGSLAAKTTSHLLTELVLGSAGVKPEQVRFAAVGQNWDTQSSALLTGTVDALMGDETISHRLVQELGASPLVDLGDPTHASAIPGAGFLRSTLFARQETVDRDPQLVERMVAVVRATLDWIQSQPAARVPDALGISSGIERDTLLRLMERGRLYPAAPRFSTRQLRETEIFFRASTPGNVAAQALSIETMVVDRWAGRRD